MGRQNRRSATKTERKAPRSTGLKLKIRSRLGTGFCRLVSPSDRCGLWHRMPGQFWGQLVFDFGAFPCSTVLKSDRCKPLGIQGLAPFCIFVQIGAGSGRRVPKSNASANSAIPASCSRVYLFGLTGRVASKIDGNFDQFSISIPGKPSRSGASRLVGLKSSSGLVKQRHDRILRKEVYRANEELVPQGWHQGGKAG